MYSCRKYSILFSLLIFFSCISFHAQAQVSDTTQKWSLQDCFQYAAEHNIQVNTLRLNEQLALQDLYVARAARIPGLSASVSNTFDNAKNNPYGNTNLVNQLSSIGNYSVNSSIVLWNDNYNNNNIQQKELTTQTAGLSIKQSLNNITLSITQAYLDILLAKENLKYIIDLVNTSEARVNQGQLFYNEGSIAKKDLLQLQAQWASDKFLMVQTQNQIRQKVLTLKQLLQLASETSFDVVSPDSVEVTGPLAPLQDVQQYTIEYFPDIKIGKLGMDIAGLDIAKAKAGFKPVISANASLGTGYSDIVTNPVLPKTGYFKQTGNNFYQRIGVTVSIPIFSNRINQANLERARISYRQADLNLSNDKLVLTQAVEQAYLNAFNARQAYEAANQQLISASETYRIVNEQYKLGAANSFDLLQQRNQYVQAVQAFTQAKYTAVLQQKIYEFYMGKPVTLYNN